MSKRQWIMVFGVWVLILAVPGFPPGIRTILIVATGLGLIVFGYRMKPSQGDRPRPTPDLPFTDSKRPASPEPSRPTDADRPVA